jgi:hypothetical protein
MSDEFAEADSTEGEVRKLEGDNSVESRQGGIMARGRGEGKQGEVVLVRGSGPDSTGARMQT